MAPPPTRDANEETSALRREDMVRVRTFAQWIFALCAFGLLVHFLNSGHAPLRTMTRWSLIALGVSAAAVWRLARNPDGYEAALTALRVFGCVAALAALVLELRIGIFSPMPAAVVFGISYFGRSENKRIVWTLGILTIAAYVCIGLAMSFDVIPDPGVFAPTGLSRPSRLFAVGSIASLYFAMLMQAQMSRRSSTEMVRLVKDAALAVRRQEAQLDEAKHDLDRALRAFAGRCGRYTGTMAGAFSIGHVVGRGAMGEVYAAVHTKTGSRAAVKILHASCATFEEDPRPRFLREARIATNLKSKNLVEVFALGEANDGQPFIAMELLEGRDLSAFLRDTPRLPMDDVLTLVRDVAEGLSVAHAAGVIHRDLKPQNLFLSVRTDGARWKVLDFGISTLAESNGTLTADGIIGTPSYMAPEQANGAKVDHRVDVFALGAVAYRALLGQPAFPGATAPQILYSVVYDAPLRPRALLPSLSFDVEAVLAIALAKDPEERFASVAELADALARAARNDLPLSLRTRAKKILARMPWKSNHLP